MKVFFTYSFSGKEKFREQFGLIIKVLNEQDISLITTEAKTYLNEVEKKKVRKQISSKITDFSPSNPKLKGLHYEAMLRTIKSSDVFIVDISKPSFRIGMEV
ncbi:MAG: hypothetical protein Q9M91_00225 [Candidatus Dojkabacteria bacterium]|nr:hypothetical protein [Candidatus Dojkabacteria bacterium]MDQ7020258.1 hypothetical protein [Candidatus Dojkabacteria bacterium]